MRALWQTASAGGIDEADPAAWAELGVQRDRQGQQDPRHEGDNARVADQVRELGAQLGLDVLGGEALEGALARLLEEEQNGHALARTQLRGALAATLP